MQMHRPAFKWEWNINTVAVLVGFGAGLVAWGYTLAELRTGIVEASRIAERTTIIEREVRRLDNHELRITNLEKNVADSASAMRALEGTLNGLAADMKVTREILQRIEAAQLRSRSPPRPGP